MATLRTARTPRQTTRAARKTTRKPARKPGTRRKPARKATGETMSPHTKEEYVRLITDISREVRELRNAKKGRRGVFEWFLSLRNPVKIMLAAGIVMSGLALTTPMGRGRLGLLVEKIQSLADSATTGAIGVVATTGDVLHIGEYLGESAYDVKSKFASAIVYVTKMMTRTVGGKVHTLPEITKDELTKLLDPDEYTFSKFQEVYEKPWLGYINDLRDVYKAALNNPDVSNDEFFEHERAYTRAREILEGYREIILTRYNVPRH